MNDVSGGKKLTKSLKRKIIYEYDIHNIKYNEN